MTSLYTTRTRKGKHELAYLAGLIGADGSLEIKEPFITIASADRDFLEKHVAPCMEAVTRRRIRVFKDRSAGVFKLRMHDRNLWETLVDEYKIPCGAKSRRITPPITLTEREQLSYVRGWFDGEGWLEILHKRSRHVYEYPRVGFKVQSKAIRNWILDVLHKHGVPSASYNRADRSYGIWMNGTAASELFKRHIGFGYPEKNKALERLIATCRGRVSA